MSEGLKCPQCGHEISAKYVARFVKPTTMKIRVTPKKGSMISAGTFGGLVVNAEKLLRAVAKELGEKCHVFIRGLNVDDEGGLNVEFMITDSKQAGAAAVNLIKELSKPKESSHE